MDLIRSFEVVLIVAFVVVAFENNVAKSFQLETESLI